MRTDLLLDEDFDLLEDPDTFDFIEGPSDDQHVLLMTYSEKTEWRESPFAGFGILRRLKAKVNEAGFKRDLQVELENDGYFNALIILGKDITDFEIKIQSS